MLDPYRECTPYYLCANCYNEFITWGMCVALALVLAALFWMLCVPLEFRARRPRLLRYLQGVLALGTCATIVPFWGVPTRAEVHTMLVVGLRCAEALGLLLSFDLIAYVRRPSSIPQARVARGQRGRRSCEPRSPRSACGAVP